MSCESPELDPNTYQVKKIAPNSLKLTGKGTDKLWDKATPMSNFTYPWREEIPPKTAFKALWDDSYFYFLYRATDADIVLNMEEGLSDKMRAVASDRVEIFFKSDDQMDPYYSLELDAMGRIFDSKGKHYREIDKDWTWPEGELVVKASMDEQGYWVEGSISLKSLRELGMLLDGNLLKAGLYRGEYIRMENEEPAVKWISWIIPDSEKPDFHIPSSFGKIKLLE